MVSHNVISYCSTMIIWTKMKQHETKMSNQHLLRNMRYSDEYNSNQTINPPHRLQSGDLQFMIKIIAYLVCILYSITFFQLAIPDYTSRKL